jgi:ABC-type Fe3+ transport system substrate-binding protein
MKITQHTTLLELAEHDPNSVETLVELGFGGLADASLRAQFGSTIRVADAAEALGMSSGDLIGRLSSGAADGDVTTAPLRVMGLVPCPIRVPMTNVLDSVSAEFTAESGIEVDFDLQAAYVGTEWMEEHVGDDPTALPDIFLSAGFRLFFTHPTLRRMRESGVFADRTGWNGHNDFGRLNGLEDPEGRFAVVGVVPAVFMVNKAVLGDREPPRSWEELLDPRYENSLALPVGDFDLFDALLLGIFRRFGMEGVRSLSRNMFDQRHPSQMIAGASGNGSGSPAAEPLVTVMPYFFTRTINESSPLMPIWPADGALTAPILLVTRSDRPEIQPMIDAISGESMSRVLSRLGLFPSTHPDNHDFPAADHPLQWPGWDMLLDTDLGNTLQTVTTEFLAARRTAAEVAK